MSMSAVAREAGLSVSTVSRFLKGGLRVSAETEARIRAAMTTVGYIGAGGSLRTVALMVPELANPYFSQLTQAISDAARQRDLDVMVLVSDGREARELQIAARCVGSPTVDGIVVVSLTGSGEVLTQIPPAFPVVVLDERVGEHGAARPFVGADNVEAAYQATTLLLARGHRRILHVAGPGALESARDRLRGFREALADAGITVQPDMVHEGPYSEAFGASLVPRLARMRPRPTAVFAGSDIVAVGIAAAAPLHGLTIPEDLSLIGIDGIDAGEWITPRLTTMVQPFEELASVALEMLTEAASGQNPGSRVLPMQLRVAESVARSAPSGR